MRRKAVKLQPLGLRVVCGVERAFDSVQLSIQPSLVEIYLDLSANADCGDNHGASFTSLVLIFMLGPERHLVHTRQRPSVKIS